MSFDDSGHWYDHDGNSAHEVDDPKNPGTMKKTDVKDARRLSLCPSTTSIQKIENRPGLNRWGNVVCAEMGAELAYLRGSMPDNQWRSMVISKAYERVGSAADAGTQYHLVIESIINDEELPDYELTIPSEFFGGFCEWWAENGIICDETEVGFCHPLGFGGRLDFKGHYVDDSDIFVDWKSKETAGKSNSQLFYKADQPVQLRSYMEGYAHKIAQKMLFLHEPKLMTVIISRDEPGRIIEKIWPEDQYDSYWERFKHELGIWVIANDYDPSWEE